MNLKELETKLNMLKKNKIVTKHDDLFVINNMCAYINNIQALQDLAQNDFLKDKYSKLVELKGVELESFYIGVAMQRLAGLGIDITDDQKSTKINSIKAIGKKKVSNKKINSKRKSAKTPIRAKNTKVKKVNKLEMSEDAEPEAQEFAIKKRKIKSLKDVMREISDASKNFKKRKVAPDIKVNLQQGKAFAAKKDPDFLNKTAPVSQEEMQQSVDMTQKSEPQIEQPINQISSNNDAVFDFNQKASKPASGKSSGFNGKDFIYDLLKSKGK